MATRQSAAVLQHVRKLIEAERAEQRSDRELLRQFATTHDEAAFAALVRRHGPMVLRVCRRALAQEQDAEDVFQATFLILLRKAGVVRWRESVAGWLQAVAVRLARKARAEVARRAARANPGEKRTVPDPLEEITGRELLRILDEELARLPENYRSPLLLCCLEGGTQEEAARHLGWSLSTLRRRLERGRELLRGRLARRGVALSAALAVPLVMPTATSAALPAGLLAATVRAALASAGSSAAAGGAISAPVAQLVDAGLKVTAATKLKLATAMLLALSMAVTGAGVVSQSGPSEKQPAEPSPPAAKAPEAVKKEEVKQPRTDRYGDPLPEGAIARLGTVRLRRENQTSDSLAFTPDGRALVSARTDRVVQFWNLTTGKPLQELRQEMRFDSFILSQDGRLLATAGFEGITLWDVVNQKQFHKIEAVGKVTAIAVSSDGRTLAYSGKDAIIHQWDVASGKVKRKLAGQTGNVHALAFTSDGKKLLSAGAHSVRAWDLAKGQESREIGEALDSMGCMALSPDDALVVTGGTKYVENTAQGRLSLWDVTTGQKRRQFEGHQHLVQSAAFSHDGRTLASAEVETIHIWDVATGKEVRRIEKTGWNKYRLVFSPDGKTLASTALGNETVIRLWNVATGRQLQPAGHEGVVRSVAYSPDGKHVATACSLGYDFSLRVWDAFTGNLQQVCQGHESYVHKVVFTPDGKGLVSASIDGTLRLWDISTGKEIRRYVFREGGHRMVTGMALSPDGLRITVAIPPIDLSENQTYTISVWDLPVGRRLLRREINHRSFPNLMSFSPDAEIVAEPEDKALVLREVTSGQERLRLELPNLGRGEYLCEPVAFSPDGRMVAALTSTWVRRGAGAVQANCTIHLWELVTGKTLLRIPGIKNRLNAVAFSPDGRAFATAGEGLIQVWDVVAGKELLVYREQDGQVCLGAVAFSPDGTKLAAGYWDSSALIWDLTPRIRRARLSAKDLSAKDFDRLWADLADGDAVKGQAAVWELAAAPAKAVRFLNPRLQPVARADSERVRRLIADLDNEKFATREAASKELAELAQLAKPALREALQGKPSAEVRRRLEALLAAPPSTPTGEGLRALRAIQVLESIRTPEAQEVLKKLAQGAPEARLTQEAKAALERLAKRPASLH